MALPSFDNGRARPLLGCAAPVLLLLIALGAMLIVGDCVILAGVFLLTRLLDRTHFIWPLHLIGWLAWIIH